MATINVGPTPSSEEQNRLITEKEAAKIYVGWNSTAGTDQTKSPNWTSYNSSTKLCRAQNIQDSGRICNKAGIGISFNNNLLIRLIDVRRQFIIKWPTSIPSGLEVNYVVVHATDQYNNQVIYRHTYYKSDFPVYIYLYPPNYDWTTYGYSIDLHADVNISNTTSSAKLCICGFNTIGLNHYRVNANSRNNIPVSHPRPVGENMIYPWIWRKEFLITINVVNLS